MITCCREQGDTETINKDQNEGTGPETKCKQLGENRRKML